MWEHINREMLERFRKHPPVRAMLPEIAAKISARELTPGLAADLLLATFFGSDPTDLAPPAAAPAARRSTPQ